MSQSGGRSLPILAVVAVAFALWAVANRFPRHASDLALQIAYVPLDPRDPTRKVTGRLTYRGGLWLRSDDSRFGGLSDLRVGADGRSLVAISDCGDGFEATLRLDESGALTTLDNARLVPLVGPRGRALAPAEQDAEALFGDGEGGLVVAFEGRPRLWRYPRGLVGPPVDLAVPSDLRRCPFDNCVEAATRLRDGRMLLVREGERVGGGPSTPAWVGNGGRWRPLRFPLHFEGASRGPFRPTSAALLASGDVLVLERYYPSFATRVRRISLAALEKGDLVGEEVGRLDPPLTLDNMEGLDVSVGPRGETLVWLLSDDNNCAKRPGMPRRSSQRTLILLFALGE